MRDRMRWIVDGVVGVFVGGAVASVALLGCVGRASTTDYTVGDSMVPTLAVGTHVALHALDAPTRGRMIVFRFGEQSDRQYMKRIVGIAGDVIAANDTEISVNGTPIPRCRVGAWSFGGHPGDLWLEALDGTQWLVFHDATKHVAQRGPWSVAAGDVFVLGDNRENVTDSRVWFDGKGGGLPLSWIIGTARDPAPTLPAGAQSLQAALDRCVASLAK